MNILIIYSVILLPPYLVCIDLSSVLYQEVFTYHNESYNKAEFAYEVVNIIYNAFRQWFFTITFCDFTYFENRILKYTENYAFGYPVMLLNGCPDMNRTKIKPRYNRHGQTAYLVTSNDLTVDGSDIVIEALKRTGVFKPRSAVIFVIKEEVEINKYFHYTVKSHFKLLWSRRVTNSVLILKSDRLRMYFYNPFYEDVREITEVKDVSRLLSHQYYNLFGHRLRLSVFRKVYVSTDSGPVLCDSRLAKTVVEFLNATCEPLVPRDGNTVGDLLDNGTATGVTADLMDGYTDLELSSRILKNSYYGYIDTTYPLEKDELCFIVKKSDKQSTFTTTIKLISMKMLVMFIFVVIILIILAIVIRKIERQVWNLGDKQTAGETALDLIKCFLRQTVDFKFWGPVFRSLVLLVIMYSLIVDCAIDGIIISAITYPRFKPDLDSISDLAKTNLTLGVHNRDLHIFNRSLSPENYANFKNRIEIFNDRKIQEVIEKRQFHYATLLRTSDANYISRIQANMKDGRPIFHVMTDCPVPCSIVYGLRYGSPYLPRIDFILNHLNQAGILQHWSETEDYTVNRKHFSSEFKETKPLNSTNLQEVFLFLLFGLLISAVVFVFEILIYTLRNYRK